MAFGTPYLIGTNTVSSATTQTITVSTGTTANDAIIVSLANTSAAGAVVNSVTDSKSNTYNRIGTAVVTHQFADMWIALGTTALTTSDTITVTFSTTSGTKNAVAVGCSGVATASAVDQDVTFNQGSGTSPSVTTGTLSQATEMAIGLINNQNLGTAPTFGGGFTQVAQQHSGTNAYTTIAYLATSSTSAVTFSATIGSTTASMILVTLLPSGGSPPVSTPLPASPANPGRTWKRMFHRPTQHLNFVSSTSVSMSISGTGTLTETSSEEFAYYPQRVSPGRTWKNRFRPRAQQLPLWSAHVSTMAMSGSGTLTLNSHVTYVNTMSMSGSGVLTEFGSAPRGTTSIQLAAPGRTWRRRFRPRAQNQPYPHFVTRATMTVRGSGTLSAAPGREIKTLIVSVANSSGVDPFGNAYVQGLGVYGYGKLVSPEVDVIGNKGGIFVYRSGT